MVLRKKQRLAVLTMASCLAACGNPNSGGSRGMTTDPNRPASFGQCAICHSVREDGPVLIGPHLVGVYGATAGTRGDFAYSQALRQSGLVWNDAALDAYIRSPQTAIRGNRMAYVGEADPAVRAEIIAYLKTLNAKTDE